MNLTVNNMFSKKAAPIWIGIIGIAFVVGIASFAKGKTTTHIEKSKYDRILHNIGDALNQVHYSPKAFDDNFSKKIFDGYFDALDGSKDLFLASDIDALRSYEKSLDDEIKGGGVVFFKKAGDIFSKRMLEIKAIYTDILSKPMNFDVNEDIELDFDKMAYPKTLDEKKERWRKRMKFQVLQYYQDQLENKTKPNAPDSIKNKTNAQLEKEARERILKNMNITFERLKAKDNDDERFGIYANVVTSQMDPHTDYFPPVEKQNFEESISGEFFGIGASLRDDDNGYIKIETLITGSPAWKSKEINPGDILLKIGQNTQPPVDLFGLRSSDAVRLIRGKSKGTEVRLTIKKPDGSTKVVVLERDIIKTDDTYAKSSVITQNGKKYGFIYLPEFYINLNTGKNGCSDDVAKEVVKLKAENVDGIIIDLRYNGGGSLGEVVKMVGLFIPSGPVVQVKELTSAPKALPDYDKSVLYDGPLTVMINEYSASASEIFAAAIQDYGRGVIVGSTSFGKGTVQRNFELDPKDPSLGAIKTTIQKFYRINGGSTQINGVVPDVALPDLFQNGFDREKDRPNALPYDEIKKAPFTPSNLQLNFKDLQDKSNARISNENSFKTLIDNLKFQTTLNDKKMSLNAEAYKKEMKLISTTSIQNRALITSANMEGDATTADKTAMTKEALDKLNAWFKGVKKDIYVQEAVNILTDFNANK